MAPQASKQGSLLPPDQQRIGCCTSNGLNSKQVPGTFSILTISSLAPQASAQNEKRFLCAFKILAQQLIKGMGLGVKAEGVRPVARG